jgi:hypothetical protein
MAKHSKVRGTGMFAMASKKDKARRPLRKQKHKKLFKEAI